MFSPRLRAAFLLHQNALHMFLRLSVAQFSFSSNWYDVVVQKCCHRNRTTLSDSANLYAVPVCQGHTTLLMNPWLHVSARDLARNKLPPLPLRALGGGAAPAHLPAGTHSWWWHEQGTRVEDSPWTLILLGTRPGVRPPCRTRSYSSAHVLLTTSSCLSRCHRYCQLYPFSPTCVSRID